MRLQSKRLFALVVAFLLTGVFAQDLQAQSNRMKNQLGFHLGLIGDPFPTLVGINANYNIVDMLRVSAGYGSFTVTGTGGDLTASTFGAGIRAMVPDWNFSPVVGLSFASVSVKLSGPGVLGDIGGFSGSASHLYATFGFDWQTGIGFNLGAGYNYSLKSGVGGLPYVNLGWYFSI